MLDDAPHIIDPEIAKRWAQRTTMLRYPVTRTLADPPRRMNS
jgi:hypothetical protein